MQLPIYKNKKNLLSRMAFSIFSDNYSADQSIFNEIFLNKTTRQEKKQLQVQYHYQSCSSFMTFFFISSFIITPFISFYCTHTHIHWKFRINDGNWNEMKKTFCNDMISFIICCVFGRADSPNRKNWWQRKDEKVEAARGIKVFYASQSASLFFTPNKKLKNFFFFILISACRYSFIGAAAVLAVFFRLSFILTELQLLSSW